jgi:hypothetical protein
VNPLRSALGKVAIVVLAAASTLTVVPAALASPGISVSYYEKNTTVSTLTAQGCTIATQAHTDEVTILDFGKPDVSGTVYGQYDYSNTFVSDASILTAVKAFSDGYHSCWTGTGNVEISWGTSNDGISSLAGFNAGTFGGDQGADVAAWDLYRLNQGYNMQVVSGAIDAELAWATATTTLQLSTAFNLHSVDHFYDFGDDAGGPCTTSCTNGWTTGMVFDIAFGQTDNYPIPEIYFTADATADWVPTSVASIAAGNGAIYFWGVTSLVYQGYLLPPASWNALESALTSQGLGSDLGDGLTHF